MSQYALGIVSSFFNGKSKVETKTKQGGVAAESRLTKLMTPVQIDARISLLESICPA